MKPHRSPVNNIRDAAPEIHVKVVLLRNALHARLPSVNEDLLLKNGVHHVDIIRFALTPSSTPFDQQVHPVS